MKLKRGDTAILIVDDQERLVPAVSNREAMIERTRMLLQGLKALGVPMIVSEQYPKGLGPTIPEIAELIDSEPLPKMTFSCYADEELRKAIDATGCSSVLVCGTETHVCVLQSAIDMKNAGKNVVIVEDCVSSRKPHDIEIGLRRAEEEGVCISTAETVLFELLERADSPEFKIISKLIK